MSALAAPDFEHCQALIRPAHGPFVLGPRPRAKPCNAKPEFLAIELIAGKDGLRGSMTLCLECCKVMLEDSDLRARVQLQPIMKETLG